MQAFDIDMTNVQEASGSRTAPKGVYQLRVTEPVPGTIQRGDNAGRPKVNMKLVINDGPHKGKWFYHTVSFLPPESAGAGFSKKFLKVIGEPYEGKVKVTPRSWANKTFKGRIGYTPNKGYVNNILEEYWHKDDTEAPDYVIEDLVVPTAEELSLPKATVPQDRNDESVPF